MIASRKPFPPDHPHAGHFSSDSFNGLFGLDDPFITHCILSPDARRWLIPVTDGMTIRFELVDSRTGAAVKLDIPAIEINNPSIANLTVAFSAGSSELVADTSIISPNEDSSGARLFRWFDGKSGKLLHTKAIRMPGGFDQFGRLRLVQRDRIVGVDKGWHQRILQLHTNADGHQSVVMNETRADPVEQPWPKPSDSLWVAHPQCESQLDNGKQFVIYCWEHYLLPKSGGIGGSAPHIPGYYFGVRELQSGKLIHTERLPDRPRKADDWHPEGWRMLGVLPETVLLLQQPERASSHWQMTWEEWRRKHLPWFPVITTKPLSLLFIEATTGKRLSELTLPFTSITHHFHPSQQALYIVGNIADEIIIQKYAYPLRKPWFLILTWAFGAFAVLASLQWLRKHRRRPV